MIGFGNLYKAGRVTRYHTSDVPAQSLAAHSWGVAMICKRVYPNQAGNLDLLVAALTHDLAELETGDIPAPAKWSNGTLGYELGLMEVRFNKRHGIDIKLTPKEQDILRWADTFELCLYCDHMIKMGNEYAGEVLANGIGHLFKIGFPTTEARELYADTFGDYPTPTTKP